MELHWNILDTARTSLLPLLSECLKDSWYLAGGTGLALQIGHRDSIDFDFFKEGDFDTGSLREQVLEVCVGHVVQFTQEEKNTLSCVIDERVQVSFFGYPYPLRNPTVSTPYFPIASIVDIGCMKLAAITSRSVEKDYVDLHFILEHISLRELLEECRLKLPALDPALILKSLVYFDDVLREQVVFKEGHHVSFEEVQQTLKKIVAAYMSGV
jgi:hypothetical protein